MESDIRDRAVKEYRAALKSGQPEYGPTAGLLWGMVAAYIAALGEVLEYMGEMNAKQRL